MKNKKKKLISVIAVVIAVVLAAGLPMIQRAAGRNSYLKVIRNNWGLSLPAGCVEVYEIDSGPSFHGDGERIRATGIAGLSIVADSLAAIRDTKVRVIRDERGLAVDFEREGEYVPFGNNDDRTDSIADRKSVV